ncbi:N-acetylglucosamine-6-phosphate deacetylase [Psychrobacillus vulpis]|uniref:N-acetylglucosamine-6-phosphate deacetylase n=1 Tax=Psychrobacillus vulpis TaxID=2325572 RepID=A0A544TTQ8_9BACI|nr:N-acetylglucosamine-6-phosphate deacetylase [Psychrobacillus vulpis]TQR20800.1 N-acetylglucosamine-6-phosphate deacetylase [Psychrobacillus vulpis]
MTEILIQNIRIALENGQLMNGDILIRNGKIAQITEESFPNYRGKTLNGQSLLALPGFIDIHIHGAMGADFMDGEKEATNRIAEYLPKEGTTSFLMTTMTQAPENIQKAIKVNMKLLTESKGAEMLGIHLEGPFINKEFAGAQPLDYICNPSKSVIEKWFGEQLEHLKIVTLAPEKDTNYDVTRYLSNHGIIVSAGHTKATSLEITEAMQNGLTQLTHYANAMSGLHHREIGVVGAGLLNENLLCEVIADGIHLSDDMLTLIYKIIGADRMILITDSMRAKGLSDGEFTLGNQKVRVTGNEARLENGTLAGSVLKMNDALKRISRLVNAPIVDLMKMSSSNAAHCLGIFERKGSLKVGKDADIVLLNNEFEVIYTFCKGKLVYSAN